MYITAMNANPGASECVLSFKRPMTYGPIMPPIWDTETISPNEAAAAVSLNIIVGRDQKTGYTV